MVVREQMTPLILISLFVALAVAVRLFAGALDGDRIRSYVESQGGQVLRKQWTPFGRGWFGSKNERIYEVEYRDAEGDVHEATCKTSVLAGVYFTEDRVVQRAQVPAEPASRAELEDENRRLRAELEQLKRDRG